MGRAWSACGARPARDARSCGTGRCTSSAGWLVLVAVLVSPLDALGSQLFSAHMLQHEPMMIVAAPLLVLGRPFAFWMWGLPAGWRIPVGMAGAGADGAPGWSLLTLPLFAWLLHAPSVPVACAAPVRGGPAQRGHPHPAHLSFLGSALLFWWAVIGEGSSRPQRGLTMLYIFTTMANTGALGALLTWSDIVWYPSYIGAGEASAWVRWKTSSWED